MRAKWLVPFAVTIMLCAQKIAFSTGGGITVTGNSGMSYGTLARTASSSVTYSSSSAARFTVTGSKNRDVYLAVTQTAVINASQGSSSSSSYRQISQTLTTSTCKYSLDGGSTWSSFSGTNSGYIWVATTFPRSSGSTSSILVRVGGSITASSNQQRGNYSGNITLSAQYAD